MKFTHTFPASWDINYILNRVTYVAQYDVQQGEGEGAVTVLSYIGQQEQYDAIAAMIEAYPVQYADEILRPKMCAQVTEKRYEAQQVMTFNGHPVPCDGPAITTCTAAVVLMDCAPDAPQVRRWKLSATNWVTLDRAGLIALGAAMANHLQECFDREEELLLAIADAAGADALGAIDIEAGWPS